MHSTLYAEWMLPQLMFALCTPADPGQTYNTSEVLKRMIADKPDVLLLAGDFSYADDWMDVDKPLPWSIYGTYTCELCRLCKPYARYVG